MTVTEKCENCRFWSEMIAQSIGAGPIEALCLSHDSQFRSQFKKATACCPAWRSNHHGAVDAPPNYGEAARAAYEAEGERESG